MTLLACASSPVLAPQPVLAPVFRAPMEHWCCWEGTDGALVPLPGRGRGGGVAARGVDVAGGEAVAGRPGGLGTVWVPARVRM
jgi:hypothetical protein